MKPLYSAISKLKHSENVIFYLLINKDSSQLSQHHQVLFGKVDSDIKYGTACIEASDNLEALLVLGRVMTAQLAMQFAMHRDQTLQVDKSS